VSVKAEGEEVSFCAAEMGLVDLDEYLPCKELAEKISSQCDGLNVKKITLDLQLCWLEYSFSYLFLDVAIEVLHKSQVSEKKQLAILLSIDLGETHFMATLLFRMSRLLGCENESDPGALLQKIQEICVANSMSIVVESRVKNPDAAEIESHTFVIGEPTKFRGISE